VKRRTKKRILRTFLTSVVVGLVIAVAAVEKWRNPYEDRFTQAENAVAAAQRTCEAKIKPELIGKIDRWQLIDQDIRPEKTALTFVAQINGKTVTYQCDTTPSGLVTLAEDDQ
jgi:hypothetical protein